ncbi:hypothetical protein B0H14DRAFT_3658592 [Mycena olivaceomarginata]|nr:hypothetical protein B0H14DRAFT_3658592 [Mycena olivaceomarginata]
MMHSPFVFLVLAASTALASMRPPRLGYRDDTTTEAPLTITLSVLPTPTQTDAAVSSAYVAYAEACGPTLSRAVQGVLEEYNGVHVPPITNISDPKFLEFRDQDTSYHTGSLFCDDNIACRDPALLLPAGRIALRNTLAALAGMPSANLPPTLS